MTRRFDGEENADIPVRSVLKCEATTGCAGPATAARWPPASWPRSATRSASSPPSRSASPARTDHADVPHRRRRRRGHQHGLPRVVELFEARKPKGLAKIAEVGGKVSIEETDKAITVVITDDAGEEHRHTFPRRTRLYVERPEDRAGRAAQRGLAVPARAARASGAAPRPSCTSSRRSRRSTSPRASTSTTSTSS